MIDLPKPNEGEELNDYIHRMIMMFKEQSFIPTIIELAKQNYK